VSEPLPGALLDSGAIWRRRVGLGLLALLATALVVAFRTTRDVVGTIAAPSRGRLFEGGGVLLVATAIIFLWPRLFAIANNAANFIQDAAQAASIGSLAEVRSQIGRLLRQGLRGGRLVLFVDDLERCHPKRALQVCEVATQLLGRFGVATVLIADMETIARSAERRLSEDADQATAMKSPASAEPGHLGRQYLEKIIQVQISLPNPSRQEMQEYVHALWRRKLKEQEFHVISPLSASPLVRRLIGVLGSLLFCLTALVMIHTGAHVAVPVGSALYIGSWGFVVLVCVVTVGQLYIRHRLLAFEENVDNAVSDVAYDVHQEDLEDAVITRFRSSRFSDWKSDLNTRQLDIIERRVASYLLNAADELVDVEAVIADYPPPLPRAAKRMMNHARLLTMWLVIASCLAAIRRFALNSSASG